MSAGYPIRNGVCGSSSETLTNNVCLEFYPCRGRGAVAVEVTTPNIEINTLGPIFNILLLKNPIFNILALKFSMFNIPCQYSIFSGLKRAALGKLTLCNLKTSNIKEACIPRGYTRSTSNRNEDDGSHQQIGASRQTSIHRSRPER